MGKIVVTEFMSVDGVGEDPGGSEGFERGGYAFEYDRGDEGDKFKFDEAMAADGLLLGRTTYEGFAQAWPSREGEFADKFNGMPKYVVSSTLSDPEWSNTRVIAPDDMVTEVTKLREAPGGDILINGSFQLLRDLMENGLVDEYRLMVFPVVLGAGKKVFGDPSQPASLSLVDSRPVGPDGVVVLTYRPADE